MSSLLLTDHIDQKLVVVLKRNARISIADLSQKLNITRATVRKRMQKLQSSGTIIGYTVVLSSDVSEMPVRGLMQINIGESNSEKIIKKLTQYNEIIAIHTSNGKWDIVLEIGSETLSKLDEITRKIKQIKGVERTDMSILLSTTRNNKALANQTSQKNESIINHSNQLNPL